jgi:hypothetical protein
MSEDFLTEMSESIPATTGCRGRARGSGETSLFWFQTRAGTLSLTPQGDVHLSCAGVP